MAGPADRPSEKPAGLKFPLHLPPATRIATVGNSTGERLGRYGNFETRLHLRTPERPLILRHFAWPGDQVDKQIRPGNYTQIDDPMEVYDPQVFLCFFGMNESWAGDSPQQLDAFKSNYGEYLDKMADKFGTQDRPAQFVLITPMAFEATGNPLQPNGADENRRLAAYARAVKEVGNDRQLMVVDLFTPTCAIFCDQPGAQYTSDGIRTNAAGDELVARLLDEAMFAGPLEFDVNSDQYKTLRDVVVDKSWLHRQDYRMLNGWYVYGGRRTWDTETFPGEYRKIRAMVSLRDPVMHAIARGDQPPTIDDSVTGEVFIPETMFGTRDDGFRKMREPTHLQYPTPQESIAQMSVPDGFEVQCFASEQDFPELANPNQVAFDDKGRLWVSCMVNYPQWVPGGTRPDDRLLILTDEDGDGKADSCKTFYDKLICPTGFEFYKDGVLVIDEPSILFLRDTDGDDVADEVTEMLDGIGTEDTHHAMGAWEWSHSGRLHMLEGIAMASTVETPWGPVYKQGKSGSYVWDLESLRLTHFDTPGQANPWCLVFDKFGNGIVGDGTNAQHHWANALSGGPVKSRKSLEPIFNNQGLRPACGNEILRSRHFPEDYHDQLIYACVINMHGTPTFKIGDDPDSAGLTGYHVDDLLTSTDMFFRPVDPKLGPDGTLYFGDWCNALIGHMQYSQRDPNRDHEHGRVYRLKHSATPPLPVVTQAGKDVDELLDQLLTYEIRTRYRTRRALKARDVEEVMGRINHWLQVNDNDEARLEALWIEDSFHRVDPALVGQLLQSEDYRVRAAAVHVIGNAWRYMTGNALATDDPGTVRLTADNAVIAMLRSAASDVHPRVRLEASRAASLINHPLAVPVALLAAVDSHDKWLDYVSEHTLQTLQPFWRDSEEGRQLASTLPESAQLILREHEIASGPGAEVYGPLKTMADVDASVSEHAAALAAVVAAPQGDSDKGLTVFNRVCASCHMVGDLGKKFGPNLTGLGDRMGREHIIRSIIWPNDEISKGYETVSVLTIDGEVFNGFILSEDDEVLRLGIANGKVEEVVKDDIELRNEMKASSMPEGLTATIAPSEFLDLLAFLGGDWIATNPNTDYPLRQKGGFPEVTRDAMIKLGPGFPPAFNDEAMHLLSGEGVRKRDFAIHSADGAVKSPAVIIRLSGPTKLMSGTIQNRGDKKFHARANTLTLWVSDDGETWQEIYTAPQPQPTYEVDFPAGTVARYIKIGLKTNGIFHIDRTVFYGEKLPSGDGEVAMK